MAWLQFTGLVWGTGGMSRREFLQKECERIFLLAGLLTTAQIRQLGWLSRKMKTKGQSATREQINMTVLEFKGRVQGRHNDVGVSD